MNNVFNFSQWYYGSLWEQHANMCENGLPKEATIISLTLEITKEYLELTFWLFKSLLTNAFYFILKS